MANITTRVLRHNIYRLKRQYGYFLELYRHLGQELDIEKGTHVYEREKINIRRAIVLPGSQHRDILRTATIAGGTQGFGYGGDFEITDRVFIIDSKDVPSSFLLTLQDYIIWESKRYNFRLLSQLEEQTGYYIVGNELKGELRYQIFDRNFKTLGTIHSDFNYLINPLHRFGEETLEESDFPYTADHNVSAEDESVEDSLFTHNWSYLQNLITTLVESSGFEYLTQRFGSFSTQTNLSHSLTNTTSFYRPVSTPITVFSGFNYVYSHNRNLTTTGVIGSAFDYTRRFMPNQATSASLRLWLRPKYGVWKDTARTIPATVDGDQVAALSDFSGFNRHMQQNTAGNRPLLKLGANGINGFAGIKFDGIDDFLSAVSSSTSITPEIFAVFRVHTATTNDIIYSSQANGYFLGTYGTGTLRLIRSDGSAIVLINGFSLETNYQLRVYYGRNLGGNASKLKLTNQTEVSFTVLSGDYAAANVGTFDIGRFNAADHYQSFTLGELCMYHTAVSDAERYLIGNYFYEEYGVNM